MNNYAADGPGLTHQSCSALSLAWSTRVEADRASLAAVLASRRSLLRRTV